MRFAVCCLACAFTARAGVVKGVVIEHVSGYPLASTSVRLQPVPDANGNTLSPLSTRAERNGQFVFSSVPAGLYLLVATREFFFPAAYGQRRPTGQGTPIQVTADSLLFTELHMHRMGAITGRVLDENNAGMPRVPVLAYPARLPLRIAAQAESDDRGVYRIHGLDPGKYWIRTAAHILDDGFQILPTFGTESREAHESRVQAVNVDEETAYADIRPQFGRLLHVGGKIACDSLEAVTVRLSSDSGVRTAAGACAGQYSFDGVAPGLYEVYAVTARGTSAGFIELSLDRDTESASIQLTALPRVEFITRRPNSSVRENIPVKVRGRRQDLSEADAERDIDTPRAALAPGRWELKAHAGPGQYIESIADQSYGARRAKIDPHPDWFDVFFEARSFGQVWITVSDQAGQMSGGVSAGGSPVPGIPVFLWPAGESTRRSLGGPRQVVSNTGGRFEFRDLPPGDYRLLATFDVSEIDEETLDAARAATVHIDPSQTATTDLSMWIAP